MPTLSPSCFDTKAMRQALAVAVPGGEWPEDRKVRAAEQPQAIGNVLVQSLHKHLVNVSIGYLFVERLGSDDAPVLAKSSKTSGPLEFYSEHAFLIRINWTAYVRLTDEQRAAMIDHHLCRFGVEETTTGAKKHVMIDPDVTEFSSIVHRWGLWLPTLRRFSATLAQRDLFETTRAEGEQSTP